MRFYRLLSLLTVVCILWGCCACGGPETVPGGSSWQTQYDLGVRYLSEGNYAEAVITFTAAIDIDPKNPAAYIGRAQAAVFSGDTEENLSAALSDYEKARELGDNSGEVWLGIADIYIQQGDYEKAIQTLEQGWNETGDEALKDALASMEMEDEAPASDTAVSDLVHFTANITEVVLDPPIAGTNTDSIGQLRFSYTWDTDQIAPELSERIWTALIAAWSPEGFSDEEIYELAGMYEPLWKAEGSLWKDYPDSNGSFPVWTEDLGTTQQVLLYALDGEGTILGYLILSVEIPAE